jgi:hypothetical protein
MDLGGFFGGIADSIRGAGDSDWFTEKGYMVPLAMITAGAGSAALGGGAAAGEGGAIGGGGGMGGGSDYLASLFGGDTGGTLSGAGNFQLGGGSALGGSNFLTTDPTSFADGYSSAGFGGGNFTTGDAGSFADGYSSSGWKDPNQGFDSQGYGKQLAKQLLSQKQGGMGGGMGGNQQGFQYQPQPVQRQAAYAPTPATFQVQDKPTDIAALVAALRSKGTI